MRYNAALSFLTIRFSFVFLCALCVFVVNLCGSSSLATSFARPVARDGTPAAVVCLLGRLYMRPVDCPFQAIDRVLAGLSPEVRCVVVDMHAEATGEKHLMAHHLKGRVAAVLGTHTHVATA